MPIRVACPMCGRTGRVPDHAVGRNIQCPACGHRRRLTPEAAIPEDIEILPSNTPAGLDDLEILDDGPVARSRPAPPDRARRRDPASRAPLQAEPGLRPPPVASSPKSVHVALAFAAGTAVVSIVVLVGNLLRADRGVPAGQPVVASAPTNPPDRDHAEAAATAGNDEPRTTTKVADLPELKPGPAVVASPPRVDPETAPPTVNGEAPPAPVVLTTADLVARCEPSVALIKGKAGSGTGFLVAPGVLATNSHVIQDEFISGLEVRFPSADAARKGPISADLLYEDEKRDLAFLAVPTDLPPLDVARSYRYRKGEDVTVIGNPGVDGDTVLENAISRGVMSTRAELDGQQFYQLGIAVNPGNSGGPVFDQSGRVIGVVTLRIPGKEELSFCIPVEELRDAMTKVTSQSQQAANDARVRHRMLTSFKNLSAAGALYGVALEMHVALKSNPGNSDLAAAVRKLDGRLQEFRKSILAGLEVEVGNARNDPSAPRPTRQVVGGLLHTYGRLKDAYDRDRTSTSVAAVRTLKSSHRQQVVELGLALGVEVPKELLEMLEDHLMTSSDVVASVPVPRGQRRLTPGDLFRQRQEMLERHRRVIPPTMARPPGPPSRFGPTPRFPGRPEPAAPPF